MDNHPSIEKLLNNKTCAPGVSHIILPENNTRTSKKSDKKTNYTCFNKDTLIAMIDAYNNYYAKGPNDDKFINYKKIIQVTKNPQDVVAKLWNLLNHHIAECNGDETCWIKQEFVDSINNDDILKTITEFTFKPKRPVGEKQWLSNFDIGDVMDQYQRIFPKFAYYGPYPSDIHEDRVKHMFNLKFRTFDEMTAGGTKEYVCFTFNTDPSTKSGAHWVSLSLKIVNTVDNTNLGPTIYFDYFDSVGNYPNKGIETFIGWLVKICMEFPGNSRLKKIDKIIMRINRVAHQQENTECGVYSINYVLKVLNNEPWEDIINNVMDDKLTWTTRMLHFS